MIYVSNVNSAHVIAENSTHSDSSEVTTTIASEDTSKSPATRPAKTPKQRLVYKDYIAQMEAYDASIGVTSSTTGSGSGSQQTTTTKDGSNAASQICIITSTVLIYSFMAAALFSKPFFNLSYM